MGLEREREMGSQIGADRQLISFTARGNLNFARCLRRKQDLTIGNKFGKTREKTYNPRDLRGNLAWKRCLIILLFFVQFKRLLKCDCQCKIRYKTRTRVERPRRSKMQKKKHEDQNRSGDYQFFPPSQVEWKVELSSLLWTEVWTSEETDRLSCLCHHLIIIHLRNVRRLRSSHRQVASCVHLFRKLNANQGWAGRALSPGWGTDFNTINNFDGSLSGVPTCSHWEEIHSQRGRL